MEQIVRFITGLVAALVLLGIDLVVYVYSGQFDVAASSPHNALERWALNTTMKRTDDEVWSIVAFIETLPRMSPDQYQQMKQQAGPETHEHVMQH
jgi:hypothetical protein